jgi:hypothetical protein
MSKYDSMTDEQYYAAMDEFTAKYLIQYMMSFIKHKLQFIL